MQLTQDVVCPREPEEEIVWRNRMDAALFFLLCSVGGKLTHGVSEPECVT